MTDSQNDKKAAKAEAKEAAAADTGPTGNTFEANPSEKDTRSKAEKARDEAEGSAIYKQRHPADRSAVAEE